jgi:hypothetical protein
MTTKTIPAYLEDERHKNEDAQLRTEEEAARILPLHHGHHRTAKQSKPELSSAVKAKAKAKAKARKPAAAFRKKARTARTTAKKTSKVA